MIVDFRKKQLVRWIKEAEARLGSESPATEASFLDLKEALRQYREHERRTENN